MADDMVIVLEGLDELQKALERFPKTWSDTAHKSLGPGLALFVTELHQTPPTPFKTGRLRSSIGSEIVHGAGSEIIGKVGTNVEYASYLEYGTSRMSARPYMKPTLEKLKDRAVKLFEDGIARVLKELKL